MVIAEVLFEVNGHSLPLHFTESDLTISGFKFGNRYKRRDEISKQETR